MNTDTAGNTDTTGAQELRNGWRTIVVAAIGVCAGITGLPFYSIGLFVRPLSAEFGWSRAAISGAALCLQLGIVLSAPIIGRVVDRVGLRRVALSSIFGVALAFAGLSRLTPSLPAYYAAWLGLSVIGCGTTPLVWTRAIVGQFVAARGLALGLTLLGTGIAGILAPAIIGHVVIGHGWRGGSLALAAISLCIAWPVVFALLPETTRAARPAATHVKISLTSLLANRAFVQIALPFFLLGLGVTGLIVHLVPMLIERGFPESSAVNAAAELGLAVIVGRVLLGFLVDRFRPPLVAFAFLMLPVGSCLILLTGLPPLAAVLLLGLAAGAEIDLLAYFVSRYFTIDHYGATYGWALSIFSLGAGVGPVLVALAYDLTHAYRVVLIVSACVITIAASCIGFLGKPAAFAKPQVG